MRIILVLFALVFLLAAPASADFNSAMSDYEKKHYSGALREFENLAEQGHPDAQYMLGYMYLRGEGVLQDYVQAHKWFNLAAYRGKPEAAMARDELARGMTSTQIAEAQKMARAWKPKKPALTYQKETSQSEWSSASGPLSRDERIKVQELLASIGYDPGVPDGVIGFKTRQAIREYQKGQGLTMDGKPSQFLLKHLAKTFEESQQTTTPRYSRRWPVDAGGAASMQQLINSLRTLTTKIERQRVSKRWITDRLWTLINEHDWPWRNLLIRDKFRDGDFTYNPTWIPVSGRFEVHRDVGLRSSVTRTRTKAKKEKSSSDLATLLLDTLLKPPSEKNAEPSVLGKIHPAEIYINQPITNAFAIRVIIKSYKGNGRLEFGPFRGSTRKAAYRLAYVPQRRKGIRLIRHTQYGSSVIGSYRNEINLEDGRQHVIEWLRDKQGEMMVSVDGQELFRTSDRGFNSDFDGFSIINRKGKYDIRGVTVYGA
ncbi:MAG: SEL1-like repeat protein, partial [Deltaproteobacteria bacterium]|nr:SEL1-like repeat protein [Deltaproteobacteria bacterium]